MTSQSDKARVFEALHAKSETFIIPNPWDAGSARVLQDAGFKALATTSAGFAWTLGRVDGEVSLEEKLVHCRALSTVTDVPLNADFENGFADAPDEAAANLVRVAEAGVVGASIEDWSGSEIYDFDLAVARIAACAEAVAKLPYKFMLTARAEGLLRQTSDLDDAIKRLQAFAAAGADVLYAPGLKSLTDVEAVMKVVSKPLNVLAPFMPKVTLAEYNTLGVARVSVGGALAHFTRAATKSAAGKLISSGSFVLG